MTRPTAAKGHMPFEGHRTCAEWSAEDLPPQVVTVRSFKPAEPRNKRLDGPPDIKIPGNWRQQAWAKAAGAK